MLIITGSCPVGMSGAPCKHQGAVSVKYHISIFTSLTPDDRMIYAYIAFVKFFKSLCFENSLGYIAEEKSFYASLRAQPQQNQILHAEMRTNDTLITEWE